MGANTTVPACAGVCGVTRGCGTRGSIFALLSDRQRLSSIATLTTAHGTVACAAALAANSWSTSSGDVGAPMSSSDVGVIVAVPFVCVGCTRSRAAEHPVLTAAHVAILGGATTSMLSVPTLHRAAASCTASSIRVAEFVSMRLHTSCVDTWLFPVSLSISSQTRTSA